MRLFSASLMVFVFVLASLTVHAQQPPFSAAVQKYVRVKADKIVLEHVRVIDGSGKAPIEDQNVVIQGGKIAAIQAGADVPAAAGISVLDLRGYSVMPGIVGMHNHLFYLARPNFDANWNWEQPPIAPQMSFSAPPALSCRWRHHDAYHRQRGDLRRLEPEAIDRRRPVARATP